MKALTPAKLTGSGFIVVACWQFACECAVSVRRQSGVSATLFCSLNQHSAPD
jgi:hypothetical protein